MASFKEIFMIDKMQKMLRNIKKIGGFRAAVKQRYLLVYFLLLDVFLRTFSTTNSVAKNLYIKGFFNRKY